MGNRLPPEAIIGQRSALTGMGQVPAPSVQHTGGHSAGDDTDKMGALRESNQVARTMVLRLFMALEARYCTVQVTCKIESSLY